MQSADGSARSCRLVCVPVSPEGWRARTSTRFSRALGPAASSRIATEYEKGDIATHSAIAIVSSVASARTQWFDPLRSGAVDNILLERSATGSSPTLHNKQVVAPSRLSAWNNKLR